MLFLIVSRESQNFVTRVTFSFGYSKIKIILKTLKHTYTLKTIPYGPQETNLALQPLQFARKWDFIRKR